MGVASQPPKSLSIHAQCFWPFTPRERRVMWSALDAYIQATSYTNHQPNMCRVAMMLRAALDELSEKD